METTNNNGIPSANTTSTLQNNASNTYAQRKRLLERLQVSPLDTLQARIELDILHPAARIMELRKRYRIDSVWVTRRTGEGKPHRVARYELHGEANQE